MRRVLEKRLSCGGNIEVTSLSCTRCETVVTGRFAPCRLRGPRPQTARFLEVFDRNRGKLKAGQAAGLLNQIQSRQILETRPDRDRA